MYKNARQNENENLSAGNKENEEEDKDLYRYLNNRQYLNWATKLHVKLINKEKQIFVSGKTRTIFASLRKDYSYHGISSIPLGNRRYIPLPFSWSTVNGYNLELRLFALYYYKTENDVTRVFEQAFLDLAKNRWKPILPE